MSIIHPITANPSLSLSAAKPTSPQTPSTCLKSNTEKWTVKKAEMLTQMFLKVKLSSKQTSNRKSLTSPVPLADQPLALKPSDRCLNYPFLKPTFASQRTITTSTRTHIMFSTQTAQASQRIRPCRITFVTLKSRRTKSTPRRTWRMARRCLLCRETKAGSLLIRTWTEIGLWRSTIYLGIRLRPRI